MSRSVDIKENPCKKYLEWNSDNGEFTWYDKEAKTKVAVALPIEFLVLDELTTIKGFYEKENAGVWSNEVKNIKEQILNVRTKSGKILSGLYEEIKPSLEGFGANYTRSLYVAVNTDEGFEIWNFQLKGAAFSGWLDFVKEAKKKIYSEKTVCHSFRNEKKGKVTFTIPEFKSVSCTEEENEAAKSLDRELQEYLTYYFNRDKEEKKDDSGSY